MLQLPKFVLNKLLFVALFLGTMLMFAGNIKADIYYGSERQCDVQTVRGCPPGTYLTGSDFCNVARSDFCELMTGSSQTVNGSDGRQYCAREVLPAIGSCSDQTFRLNGPSNDYAAKALALPGTLLERLREVFKGIASDNGTCFDAQSRTQQNISIAQYLEISDGGNLSTSDNQQIRCGDINGEKLIGVPGIKIPYLHDKDNDGGRCLTRTDTTQEFYRSTYAKNSVSEAINLGLVVDKAGSSVHFCSSRNAILFSTTEWDVLPSSEGACIINPPLINAEPGCVVNLNVGNEAGNLCIRGKTTFLDNELFGAYAYISTPTSFAGINIGSVDVESNFGGAAASPNDDLVSYVPADGSNLCKYTAKDFFATVSNKGCSDFVRVKADNTLEVIDQQKYSDCTRCIYGEPALITDVRSREILLAPGSTAPANGDSITPDNEPFASARPGYIYNDLGGCVNASDAGSVINTIVRLALGLMGGLVIIRIIQGALTMQRGDPEGFQEGRDIIVSALVGLILLILSAAILNFLGINILQLGGSNGGFQPFGG